MSCTPHPQVISPCADDAVSVGQSLGTRGDVAYDEAGSLALTVGQTSVSVQFSFTKESAAYVFEYLYIKTGDAAPVDIRPVLNGQTKQGFTCELSGMPISANSMLFWRVVVPDPLHSCAGAANGPQYAIVKPAQQGITAIPQNQSYIDVTFTAAQDDDTWEFESAVVHVPNIVDIPLVFAMICTVHTRYGFRIKFSGSPDQAGYTLHWRIRAL